MPPISVQLRRQLRRRQLLALGMFLMLYTERYLRAAHCHGYATCLRHRPLLPAFQYNSTVRFDVDSFSDFNFERLFRYIDLC